MASSTKRFNKVTGREFWQVRIRRKGYPPISKNFDTKRQADDYGILIESKLLRNEAINPHEASKWTIPDVIDWYRRNPDPQRKLETTKQLNRLKFLETEFENFSVNTLTPGILSKWIQKRLAINAPSTVYHYYVALKNALVYHAVQHDYAQTLFTAVKCPSKPGQRNRRFSKEETRQLFKSIRVRSKVKKKEMMLSVLFSLETACRVGEMIRISWSDVNLENRYLDFRAENTKTKEGRRIPLTSVAVKILKWFKKVHNPERLGGLRVFQCWNLNEHHLSKQFQICCGRAEIEDIRWHDLRHEGTSRLFEWVNPRSGHTLTDMEIASITGHKSMNMLRRYAHLRPSSIIPKLW
jgi:integrase